MTSCIDKAQSAERFEFQPFLPFVDECRSKLLFEAGSAVVNVEAVRNAVGRVQRQLYGGETCALYSLVDRILDGVHCRACRVSVRDATCGPSIKGCFTCYALTINHTDNSRRPVTIEWAKSAQELA